MKRPRVGFDQAALGHMYTHASAPHTVAHARKKHREPVLEELPLGTNIMFDRRVVRGSTYAAQVGPGTKEFDQTASQAKAKPKDVRKRQKPAADRSAPPPVDGRKHIELQTEQYLEELTDRPPEAEAEVQTDAFVELLPQPLFVPVKSGVDAGTQVEDGELFDFDVEANRPS